MRGMGEQGLSSRRGVLTLIRGSSARSIITTIGNASSGPLPKRIRTTSAVPTSVIFKLELQSLTVAALQAHDKPPDPMQTSEPYFQSDVNDEPVPLVFRCHGAQWLCEQRFHAKMRKFTSTSAGFVLGAKVGPPGAHVGQGRRTRQEPDELVAGDPRWPCVEGSPLGLVVEAQLVQQTVLLSSSRIKELCETDFQSHVNDFMNIEWS